MSVGLALLAACSILLGAREIWADRGERSSRSLIRLGRRLPIGRGGGSGPGPQALVAAAGLAGRLDARLVPVARAIAALSALPAAIALAPTAPGQVGTLLIPGLPLVAVTAPDLILRRLGARRRALVAAGLPAVLELMANGAGAGRGPRALLADAAIAARGPLAAELGAAAAALECGRPHEEVVARLANGGPSLSAVGVLLERSRTLGAPLAAPLAKQADALREEAERLIEERGARAAPKIQLVVALILVPSVLLIVAAAIVANSGQLSAGL